MLLVPNPSIHTRLDDFSVHGYVVPSQIPTRFTYFLTLSTLPYVLYNCILLEFRYKYFVFPNGIIFIKGIGFINLPEAIFFFKIPELIKRINCVGAVEKVLRR